MSAEQFLDRVIPHLAKLGRDKFNHTAWRYQNRPTSEGVGVLPVPAVFVSAHLPASLEGLKAALLQRLRARLTRVRVTVPARDGDVLAALHREGEVLSQESRGADMEVTARVPEPLLGRLRNRPNIQISELP